MKKITADLRYEFWHWFKETWSATGGLIPHSLAATILNKTQTRIRQMVSEGKLNEYNFKGKKYLSYIQVQNMARDEAFEDLKAATQLLYKDAGNIMEQLIEKEKNRIYQNPQNPNSENKN